MRRVGVEIAVGIFIIAGLLCLAYVSINLGKVNLLGKNYYSAYYQDGNYRDFPCFYYTLGQIPLAYKTT